MSRHVINGQEVIRDILRQRISVVFYEEFTGDGSDKTFQLTSSPDNATWLDGGHGAWVAGNIHTAYPAHITKTNKKPIYDSLVPLIRNRITVSSISAAGLVTLDYAPRSSVDFYVWYWYHLTKDDVLSDYHKQDFIASMEGEMIGTVSLYDTDSSNVLTLAWNEDSSNDRTLSLAGLVGGNRTFTLNESLTVGDGNSGTVTFSAASKTLTVENNAIVSQDYSSDSTTVIFAGLTLTGGFKANLVTKTGAYTTTTADYTILCDASGGSFTITLIALASHLEGIYHIKKIDSSVNTVTVDGNGAETIDGATTAVLTVQYESITIQAGSEWGIL